MISVFIVLLAIMVCINVNQPGRHSKNLSKSGLCFCCCGRMSAGNRTGGQKKRVAAMKGYGQTPKTRKKSRMVRVSVATEGFEDKRARLVALVRGMASSRSVSQYAKSITKQVLKRRSSDKLYVTLIEGPSYPGSELSKANASLGGASLRIVEPFVQGAGPMVLRPPPLKLGAVVDWPLDLFTDRGIRALGDYLERAQPCAGTSLIH